MESKRYGKVENSQLVDSLWRSATLCRVMSLIHMPRESLSRKPPIVDNLPLIPLRPDPSGF